MFTIPSHGRFMTLLYPYDIQRTSEWMGLKTIIIHIIYLHQSTIIHHYPHYIPTLIHYYPLLSTILHDIDTTSTKPLIGTLQGLQDPALALQQALCCSRGQGRLRGHEPARFRSADKGYIHVLISFINIDIDIDLDLDIDIDIDRFNSYKYKYIYIYIYYVYIHRA